MKIIIDMLRNITSDKKKEKSFWKNTLPKECKKVPCDLWDIEQILFKAIKCI